MVVVKFLPKILFIKPLEHQNLKNIVELSEYETFLSYCQSLTVFERAMLNHIIQLDKTIKMMRKFDQETLNNEQKKLKWKFAAKCINCLLFYVAIIYSLIIYITFFINCANITNKPYPALKE